jgi:hypothetical protein
MHRIESAAKFTEEERRVAVLLKHAPVWAAKKLRQGYHSTGWGTNAGERTADPRTGNVTHVGIEAPDLSSSAHSVPKCEENGECGGNR